MGNDATTGRQLFIDLIAASSQPRPRSAFETVAWAVAAERAGAQRASTPVDETNAEVAALGAPADAAADAPAGGPGAVTMPAAPVALGLRLMEDLDEPPLHPTDPSSVRHGPSAGPRIRGFAAATGAALTPIPAGPTVQDSRTPPPGSRPGGPSSAHQDGTGYPSPGLDEPHHAPTAGPADPSEDAADDSSALAAVATDPDPDEEAGPEPAAAAAGPREPKSARSTALPEDDDDFGPLILPDAGHRRRWFRRGATSAPTGDSAARPRGNRRLLWAIALPAALIVAVAGAWWLRPAPATPTPPPPQRPDVVMQDWHGIALPISTTAGPAVHSDARASRFAQTPLGAAIAAAHLSVRTDPAAGPEVFEPVLADQVVGDADRLAGAVREQFTAGVPEGAPGQLLGWRVDGDPASGSVLAHLQVRHADGNVADYAVPLAWVAGDWRIYVPETGAFFPVTGPSGRYASFAEEATP